MLMRITNYCTMNCTHCMISADKYGGHMAPNIFKDAINFNYENDRSCLIISGGEPTDHPDFLSLLNALKIYQQKIGKVLILSNGLFLENIDYREKILKAGIDFQITNDKRYYPKRIIKVDHPLLTYEYNIRKVSPFGRALINNIKDLNNKAPLCYNLRSCSLQSENLKDALLKLRLHSNFCTPSINIDGTIVMGETPFCYEIGSIYNDSEKIHQNIISSSCNKCKLSKNLTELQLAYWNLMEANLI